MAITLGLDIGTRTITGAVFSGTAKKFRLVDFFVREIPRIGAPGAGATGPDGSPGGDLAVPPSLEEVLRDVLGQRTLDAADVVAAVEAKDAIVREIIVPFTRDDHIRKVINAEAEEHFQTIDTDEVQLEFFKVEELGDKSRVVIAAVKNDAIQDRLDTLKAVDIDPISLDLDAAALFNAFALTPTFDPQRTVLLVDMGATSAKALLIEKGQLKKVRSVRLGASAARMLSQPVGAATGAGGGDLPPLLSSEADSLEARFAEIENALRRLDPASTDEPAAGYPEGEEPIAVLTEEEFDLVHRPHAQPQEPPATNGSEGAKAAEAAGAAGTAANGTPLSAPEIEFDYDEYLERLGIEIQRTFATSMIGGNIDLICLTGGMSQRDEAVRFFSERFDVETIHLDFGDSFAMDVPEEQRGEVSRIGAVAVGLGIKQLGRDRIGFDFRKNRFRFERKFERIKYPVLALAIMTLLVFLHGSFLLWKEMSFLKEKVASIQEMDQQVFQAFFGKKNDSANLHAAALVEKKRWEQILGVGGQNIPVFIPVLDGMQEIGKALLAANAQFRVIGMDVRLKTVQKSGRPLQAEGDTRIDLTTTESGLGTRLQTLFGRPNQIFSANVSESTDALGTSKLTLTLTPRPEYLSGLKK